MMGADYPSGPADQAGPLVTAADAPALAPPDTPLLLARAVNTSARLIDQLADRLIHTEAHVRALAGKVIELEDRLAELERERPI
jgi:hypothetical protein